MSYFPYVSYATIGLYIVGG
jgi:hypothetical protein